ncbi:hypothetical protein C5L14_16230 [Labrys okinawensis]|uniref:Uncharacterized protein n=1 Tax=Labrys okinawensis TaxID=346911 RepID=A0A2S9QBX4_9HYPH|nr:hypothetical protein [Labrys okinawensis]PRH86838.1 hypothetical protein C5L14_16230 [Labrys okinawensis]
MPAAPAIAQTYRGPFAEELAKLQKSNPIADPKRWEQAKHDAIEFLTDWGDQVAELGWSADDLFGLHPTAPLARYDVMGLIWLLQGQAVSGVTERSASTGATTFYRAVR